MYSLIAPYRFPRKSHRWPELLLEVDDDTGRVYVPIPPVRSMGGGASPSGQAHQPILRPRPDSPIGSPPASEVPKRRRSNRPEIDLTPKPVVPDPGRELSDDEWEQIFGQLKEHGWPEDVVDQVRSDRKEGITRTYVLRVSDVARYLGLSRSGLDKLITAGKLRVSTIRSQYRDEKAEKLIPAKEVLALK